MSHPNSDVSPTDNDVILHEPDSIWAGTIGSLGVGLLLLVIFALLGVAFVLHELTVAPHADSTGKEWSLQTLAPGVEPNQAYQREQVRREEDEFLRQYAWENQQRRIARIPIARGIELMAQRRLQVNWPQNDAVSATTEPDADTSTEKSSPTDSLPAAKPAEEAAK